MTASCWEAGTVMGSPPPPPAPVLGCGVTDNLSMVVCRDWKKNLGSPMDGAEVKVATMLRTHCVWRSLIGFSSGSDASRWNSDDALFPVATRL